MTEKKVFKIGDEDVTLEEIAVYVKEELKCNTVPLVVNMFRKNGKLELLEAVLPLLTKTEQGDIETVLCVNNCHLYS